MKGSRKRRKNAATSVNYYQLTTSHAGGHAIYPWKAFLLFTLTAL